MVDTNGQRIDMIVHENIPYVSLETDECEPHYDDEASRIHNLLLKKSSTDGSHRVVYIDSSSGDEVDSDYVECNTKQKCKKKKNK